MLGLLGLLVLVMLVLLVVLLVLLELVVLLVLVVVLVLVLVLVLRLRLLLLLLLLLLVVLVMWWWWWCCCCWLTPVHTAVLAPGHSVVSVLVQLSARSALSTATATRRPSVTRYLWIICFKKKKRSNLESRRSRL
jgi:hypothetical protein